MQKNFAGILEEIYLIDPKLREKDREIQKIVKGMLDHRPKVPENEAFKVALKARIVSEVLQEQGNRAAVKNIATQRLKKENRKLRMVWYFVGWGLLFSFAGAFGFFHILGPGIWEKPAVNIPQVSVDEKAPLALTGNSQENDSALTLSTPSNESDTPINEELPANKNETTRKVEQKKAAPADIQAKVQTESTEIQDFSDTVQIMEAPVVSEQVPERARIAYVGETVEMPSASPTPEATSLRMATPETFSDAGAASDTDMNMQMEAKTAPEAIPNETANKDSVNFLPFSTIVSRAIEKSMALLGEEKASLYVLKTPSIQYIPEGTDKGIESSLDLVPVYIFPMEKIGVEGIVVREIVVSASE